MAVQTEERAEEAVFAGHIYPGVVSAHGDVVGLSADFYLSGFAGGSVLVLDIGHVGHDFVGFEILDIVDMSHGDNSVVHDLSPENVMLLLGGVGLAGRGPRHQAFNC